jgi:hypothetical protein
LACKTGIGARASAKMGPKKTLAIKIRKKFGSIAENAYLCAAENLNLKMKLS